MDLRRQGVKAAVEWEQVGGGMISGLHQPLLILEAKQLSPLGSNGKGLQPRLGYWCVTSACRWGGGTHRSWVTGYHCGGILGTETRETRRAARKLADKLHSHPVV